MIGRSLFLVLALALLTLAAPVLAAPPSAEAAAEARRFDQTAEKLAKSGAFREALAALRRSLELVPKPATLKRIGALQRETRDFAAAHATFTEVKTRFAAELRGPEKVEVDRALDELAAITGTIRVKLSEPGARVAMDGAPIGEGPLDTAIRVNLGPHTVHAEKLNFTPFDAKPDAQPKVETVVTIALAPSVAQLAVRVRGGRGRVRVDGTEVGATPWKGQLPPGKHVVESGEGPSVARREVDLLPGQQVEIDLEIEERAKLSIQVEPWQASIVIDGRRLPPGKFSGVITAGTHVVEVSFEGFEPKRLELALGPGEDRYEQVRLVEGRKPGGFPGIYADVGLMFVASPSTSNFVTDACAVRPATCEGSNAAYGAAIPVRVGYSFGFLGVEGIHLERYSLVNETIKVDDRARINFYIHSLSLAHGLGVRYMPRMQTVRPTGGFALAWVHHESFVSTQVHRTKAPKAPVGSGDAPMLMFDAAVLIGHTPGTKLRLALEATVEFNGDGYAQEQYPTVILGRGTTVFLGPSIGVQMGH